MTEDEAWDILQHYSSSGNVEIAREMSISDLRRRLAKVYQPRRAGDDDSAMRKINPAIDIIDAERDKRELLGIKEPQQDVAEQERSAREKPPWQTDPYGSAFYVDDDYSNTNFIQKIIHQRSVKFGSVGLVKAWAWDGNRFRKVISAQANQFAYEEFGRALLRWLLRANVNYPCKAVFLTEGDGKAESFRLILVKTDKGYENVISYDRSINIEPDSPNLANTLNGWINEFKGQLFDDRL